MMSNEDKLEARLDSEMKNEHIFIPGGYTSPILSPQLPTSPLVLNTYVKNKQHTTSNDTLRGILESNKTDNHGVTESFGNDISGTE